MANFLGTPISDDALGALGLLGFGMAGGNFPQGGLLAMKYLDEAPDRRLKNQLTSAQIDNFNSEVEQRKAQTGKLTEGMSLLKGILGGQAAPAYQPGQLGSGTMGILPNDNPTAPAPAPARGLAAATPEQIALAKMYGFDLEAPWKVAKEGFSVNPGTYTRDAYTGALRYNPDPVKGVNLGADGSVGVMPNFLATNAAIKGIESTAQERAKAANTLLPLDYVDRTTRQPIGGSTLDYLDRQPMQNQGGGSLTPDLSQAIRRDAAANGISSPNVNLTGAGPGQAYGFQRSNVGAPTQLQSKAEAEGAAAAAKLPFQTAEKVNETWLKTSYEPAVAAGNAANDTVVNAQVARDALRGIGNTGWGTEVQAAGANVLTGLGLAPESAKALATNSQKFQAAAMTNLWTTLNAAKGPQTEGDANRARATYAQLSNTPQANEFILDLTEAKAMRDQVKARFFQEALPIAREKGDLQEVEREWLKRAPSVFSMPSMQRWKGSKK